jgi:hypothetical protein
MTVTTYTVHVVNESTMPQIFWFFMAPPKELTDSPGAFATSSIFRVAPPNDPAIAVTFDDPVQYAVGAGVRHESVGSNVEIIPDVILDASLQQQFLVDYASVQSPGQSPDRPIARLFGANSPPNTISLTSNTFDQAMNEDNGWFSSMSFGRLIGKEIIGVTWSPTPGTTQTLTPSLTFYVAIGSFGSNRLVSREELPLDSIAVSAPDSFRDFRCTVTYRADGSWSQEPGGPAARESQEPGGPAARALGDNPSQFPPMQRVTVFEISWDKPVPDGPRTFVTGTLSVFPALEEAFYAFYVNGVTCYIRNPQKGVDTFEFMYLGLMDADEMSGILQRWSEIFCEGVSK